MDSGIDSGYCPEEKYGPIDEGNYLTIDIDRSNQPVDQDYDAPELDEFGETKRKYKALYFEDIRIWIVPNPKRGQRDLLAMEVLLRHHKGVDNKPKP
jgi:hypothetical protein